MTIDAPATGTAAASVLAQQTDGTVAWATLMAGQATTDLGNVSNTDFAAKAAAAGVGGSLPTPPGAGWHLSVLPDGSFDWVQPIPLPGLHGLETAGSGGWAFNASSGGNGSEGSGSAYTQGGETGLTIIPAIGGGTNDGRYVRTGDLIRTSVTKRVIVVGRMAITALMTSGDTIRGGLGFVTADNGAGWASPPFGGDWAVVNFELSATNTTALYASTCKGGTVNKVLLLDNVTAGQTYTVSVTLNTNGTFTYRVDTGTPYTESGTTYIPASSTKLAIGFFCNRRTGSTTNGVKFMSIQAFKPSN